VQQHHDHNKTLLRELGDCIRLSIAIAMADYGMNPLVRFWGRTRVQLKDTVKVLLRSLNRGQVRS